VPTSSGGGGGGAAGGAAKLFDSTLAAPAATIDSGAGGFVGTYAALQIMVYARTAAATPTDELYLRLNNDATAVYDWQRAGGSGTTAVISTVHADNGWDFIVAANSTASVFGVCTILIPNYAGTVAFKTATLTDGFVDNSAGNERAFTRVGQWRSTAAITRVSVVAAFSAANLMTGSRLVVWGL
jgi:hypothetical protein